jgi:hypothetical protein
MAQHQSGTQGTSGMQGTSGTQGTSGAQGAGMQQQASTRTGNGGMGTDNVTYDLISVAYHALQAAQTYQQYERDAQRGGQQFSDFFRKVCDTNKQCADEALRLLGQCLGGQGMQGSQGVQGSQGMQQGGQSAHGTAGSGDTGQYGRGTR